MKALLTKKIGKKTFDIIIDSIWTTIGRVGGLACGIFVNIIIAKYYGPQALGKVTVVNSFLNIVTILTVFGSSTSILKLIPEYQIKYSLKNSFTIYKKVIMLVIICSVVTTIVLLVFSRYVIKDLNMMDILFMGSFFIIFRSILTIAVQAIRGLGEKSYYAIMQVLPQAPNLILLVIFALFVINVYLPIYAYLVSLALSAVISLLLVHHIFKTQIKKELEKAYVKIKTSYRELLKLSLPMFFTDSSFIILSQTGVLLLGFFIDETSVGYYSVAVSIATMSNLFVKSINSVVAPKFSKLFFSNKEEEIFVMARNSAKVAFWVTFPITLIIVLFGHQIIHLLFGKQYVEVAYLPMVILALGQLFNAACGATATMMNMTGHHIQFRNIMFVTITINTLLSVLLILTSGIIGASIAATASSVIWNSIVVIYLYRKYKNTVAYFPI